MYPTFGYPRRTRYTGDPEVPGGETEITPNPTPLAPQPEVTIEDTEIPLTAQPEVSETAPEEVSIADEAVPVSPAA